MIISIFFLLVVAVVFLWFILKKKRRVKVAQGIETYDTSGSITFSTENKLFRYVGYRDLTIGDFSITANVSAGNVVFIPITLSTNNPEISNNAARGMDMPYISGARINGNTFSGNVNSPALFHYGDSLKHKPLIRVFYGVY